MDWPPPGWTEHVKLTNGRKIKYYTNVETGKKFYSKKEVTRYMNTKDTCHDVTQAMDDQDKSCSENNVSQMNNQDKSCSENDVSQMNNQDKSCSEKNVSQMNNQDKSCSEKNVSQMNNQDKSCSENNVSQTVGGPNNTQEWLPPGWIVELKTRKSGSHAGTTYKVYIDPSTGNKFYSKPEVSKYLKTMEQNNIAEGQIHGNGEVSSSNQKTPEDSKSIRGGGQSRKSKRQKSDTHQSAYGIEEGSVSKKKASQDSEEVGEQSCISNRKKSGTNRPSTKTSSSHGSGEDFPLNEKTSLGSKENGEQSPLSKRQKPGSDTPSAKSVSSVAGDSDSVDELPPGWKKEFIIRENDPGTRKDPLYTDPVHGYKFHSKKEVLSYLQTGDASRCARRSAKRNVASTTKDDFPMTDDASLKKSGRSMTGRQLFATDDSKGAKSFGTCSPAQQVESSKKPPDFSVSDPNTIISSILAEINENHSFENVIEDAEIETVSVDVTQPSAVSTKSDPLPEKQLLENEQEKLSHKAASQQSRKSKNTESRNLGRRVSKRLAGQNPEAEAANLDLGECALPSVVEKSASVSLSMNVCGQDLLQDSDPTPETGNSDQAALNGEASLDELPPGWKKEIKITKKANGIRKDPLYIDPVHGYVLRSKKDVFRYLQTGDINSCAIRPVKRDLDVTMKESSPTAANTNSKKLECSVTERQPFAAKESRGRKRSDTCSPEIQAKSSKKQPESSVSNANTIITSSAADINAKHSDENVIENTEISVDTEPEIRDSSADTKVIAAQSDAIKRLSAVSTPPSDLPPEQQLPENEHEKHINKEKLEQSRRSRTKKPITPGRRISKRLVGHSPEPVADLDLGERAFRAVVKKSASLGIPLNVSAQEFSQNKDPAVGTGNSDQASLNREASGNEFPPDREKEILTQNKDPTVGTGNSDQASLSREASGDELSPGLEKEMLAQNKDLTVGTGNSDQASLSREASGDERLEKEILTQNEDPTVGTGNSDRDECLEKEILAQNKDPTVGTGNSDQASLSREASGDKLSPGLEKEMFAQNNDPTVGAGNSDQASLSREASGDKLSPGLEKEMFAQNKDPTVGAGNSDQASLSREASGDKLSPGLEMEMLGQNNDPTVGTGNSDQASLSREASGDKLSPGLEMEMLGQNNDPTVGTGNSDQASLSRKASGNELSPDSEKEILAQIKDRTVGTGNSDLASLSREASLDEIPPGWEKEILRQKKYPTVGTGNSGQASLSRKLSPDEIPPGWENVIPPGWKNEIPAQASSLDEIPPGWEKEILAYNKNPTIRTGNSDQASLSRKLASADELPPGWEKEMLTRNKVPTVGTGNSDSLDDIPPGWEKELLFQNKDPKVGTGNSNQSFLSREASVDELPPGWKTEFRTRKNARGIKKDPYYTDPVHGYVFRSKKDVMRYLHTGDIRSCAVKPTKRDPDSTMKDDSPSTHDTSSKKLGCSLTGRQLSATEESKDRKCSATSSLALQAESSNEHHESSVFNLNNSISSTVADVTDKHLCENVNEDANKGVPARSRKLRNSKSSTPVRRVSKRLSRHNQEMVADLDAGEHAVVNNSASLGLPLNVSGGELAQQTDLATGDSDQPSLRRKASSRDDPLKVVKCLSEGQACIEQKVANGLTSEKQNDERILQGSQPAGISRESRKFHLEHQAVKERPTGKLAKEEQDSQYRLLNNSQPAELASGRRVFPAEDRYVSERSTIEQVSEKRDYENKQWQDSRPTGKLEKEEQDSQYRLLNNSQPAELASGRRVFPAEDRYVSERSTIEQVSEKRDYENKQWQDSQLAEPSWRSVDLNVENQQWHYSQLAPSQKSVDLNVENQQWQYSQLAPSQRSVDLNAENQQWQYSQLAPSQRSVDLNAENQQWQYSQLAPSQRSVDLNVENQQWQDSQLAPSQRSVDLNVVNQQWQDSQLAPSQRSVDLNVVNQQWQDSQLAPSQRSMDLNVANLQWQDSQLAEPSQRIVDLNVANQPVREKQTGELVTENQDEQNRRLHAQLASYPFGDYWSDSCLEFAFKTLTGALPVEDNMPFQESAHQEYHTSYTQADDGCFELPLFNTSSFYMNDVPNHCAPSEEHVVKEQPPINQTFLPNGNNSMPGCSNVVSQNPGLAFFPNGNNSIPGYSSVGSQNPSLDPQAKDYQSKFKSQR